MFCLRAWIPLLFLPTNASPVLVFPLRLYPNGDFQNGILKSCYRYVVTFFVLTYLLNRPCICGFNSVAGNRVHRADDH